MQATSPAETLFAGRDLLVRARRGVGDPSLCVVTFQGHYPQPDLAMAGFGEQFCVRHGIAAIHVTTAANHWYQTAEMAPALAAIAASCRDVERLVTYGSSMGGYGAAIASAALGAAAILAVNPQFSIDPARSPWEQRWREEAARLDFRHDAMAAGLRREAELFLLYDPMVEADRRHAEALAALSAAPRRIIAPFGGHPVTFCLEQAGILSALILPLLRGTEGVTQARARVRAGRARSSFYFSERAARRFPRHPAAALDDSRRALAMMPGDAEAIFAHAQLLMRAGQYTAAVPLLLQSQQREPEHERHAACLGHCMLHTGFPAAAAAHLREAIRLTGGTDPNHWAALFECSLRLGRRAEARESVAGMRAAGAPAGFVARFEQALAAYPPVSG